jgi:hypothetical protein
MKVLFGLVEFGNITFLAAFFYACKEYDIGVLQINLLFTIPSEKFTRALF